MSGSDMGRNHSRVVTSRRNQGTKIVNKVILFCEGRNTEPSYFELLKKNNCKVVPVVVPGHGIGSCVEFVEEANKKYNCLPRTQRDKYSQKWLVYDCDGHDDFAASIKWCMIVMDMMILLPVSSLPGNMDSEWPSQICVLSIGLFYISIIWTDNRSR